MLQHRFELAGSGGPTAFSTCDNLLLAHHTQTGTVQVFDVIANAGQAVAPPQRFALALRAVQSQVTRNGAPPTPNPEP